MLLDEVALKKSSEPDRQFLDFVKVNPLPPMEWDDCNAARISMQAFSQRILATLGPPEPGIHERYQDISMRDGFLSTIKIYTPALPPPSGSPLIVDFFGGGFISGDMDQGTARARAYVRLFGAVVVSPSYRLAPQHKFPTSQYDAWDTIKWLDGHAEEIGASPRQGFIVSGVSAGGSIAAVVATHAIEEKLTNPITGQYLNVPMLFESECVPEQYKPYFLANEHNRNAPIISTGNVRNLAKQTSWDAKSPWQCPINSKAPLSKQPPAYFQVDGMDPLRDDGLIWEEMLKQAGVRTRIDLYPGWPHAHASFLPGLEISNRAIADQLVGMGWLLGIDLTPEQGLGAMKPASV